LSATARDLDRLDPAVLGQDLDVVNFTTATGLGYSADNAALVLPPYHFYGLGKCRAVPLGDHQIAAVFAVGDSGSSDLPRQVAEIKFACPRPGSGRNCEREQQNYQQRFHHQGPEGGFKGDPQAQSSKQVTPIATEPVTETGSLRVYGAGLTSTRIRSRLPGSVGILVAYFWPLYT